jgi:hypothetical protein
LPGIFLSLDDVRHSLPIGADMSKAKKTILGIGVATLLALAAGSSAYTIERKWVQGEPVKADTTTDFERVRAAAIEAEKHFPETLRG